MNPQDIRSLVNQLTLLEAGEPTNPSRRGFLKKAGAGVAVASAASLDPTGTIVKGLVKDLGFDNLSALDQLLKVATPKDKFLSLHRADVIPEHPAAAVAFDAL